MSGKVKAFNPNKQHDINIAAVDSHYSKQIAQSSNGKVDGKIKGVFRTAYPYADKQTQNLANYNGYTIIDESNLEKTSDPKEGVKTIRYLANSVFNEIQKMNPTQAKEIINQLIESTTICLRPFVIESHKSKVPAYDPHAHYLNMFGRGCEM